jgi:hypothetical protein
MKNWNWLKVLVRIFYIIFFRKLEGYKLEDDKKVEEDAREGD